MIQPSQAAANDIKRLKSKLIQPNLLFRLTVKPGGCFGWFHDMSFSDEQALADCDHVFTSNDIQVVVDTKTLKQIQGLKIEYSEDLMGGGFRFYNPQAEKVCGCGICFSVNSEQLFVWEELETGDVLRRGLRRACGRKQKLRLARRPVRRADW